MLSLMISAYSYDKVLRTIKSDLVIEILKFDSAGFALLKLNYIGSTGSKKDETDELLGKVGKLDVKDCHEIVQQTLKSVPCLDSERIGLFGGSHGGFLSAHLSGQYPVSYSYSFQFTFFGTHFFGFFLVGFLQSRCLIEPGLRFERNDWNFGYCRLVIFCMSKTMFINSAQNLFHQKGAWLKVE